MRAPVRKTSLNSEPPVSCSIGRTSTPSWSIGTSRNDSPWCRSRAGLGAGDHEEPLAEVGVGRPHLLAVEHPLVAVAGAPWSARWPGRSRRRARSSPAPTAPRRPGSWAGTAPAAPAVPNAIRVGPSSSSPRWLTRTGRVGPGVLLVEDHLLPQAQPAAAVLRRPADAGPAVLGEVPVPGQPLLDAPRGPPGAAEPLQRGELAGQVLLEPAADLGAEGLVLVGVAQVHVWYSTKQMLGLRDRCPPCSATPRSGSATTRRTSRAAASVSLPRAAAPGSRRAARGYVAGRASARATGSCSGGPTASTGRSPRSPCRTPAACWCRSTRATSAPRSPTSSSAPAPGWSWCTTASSAATSSRELRRRAASPSRRGRRSTALPDLDTAR